MTRYSSTMTEALQKIREGVSTKQIKEDGHTDVKSAKNQVKIAMTALQKMEMELGKLNDEDSLPSWWTNKVAVAVDNIDGMSDYLDTQVEELDLDELKMDDPKLVRKFDKLKRGDTVKLKTSSTISKGTDFVDYVVKAKNTVNKGRVEKITLVTKGNEKAVKKFLYKRDGKVTFAIGDMGASIDDIKEKLGKDADAGDYIDDFKKSDAPQFKGKSDKKKRDMAIAAYLDAKDKKEEVEKKPDKPDSAKAVDQMRDDKKKTRIAQLQLQIAKATEMINKLNSQEKPDA